MNRFCTELLALPFLVACSGSANNGPSGSESDASRLPGTADASSGADPDAETLRPRTLYVSVGDEPRLAVVELGIDGSLKALPNLDLTLPGRPGAMAYARTSRRLFIGTRPGAIATVSLDASGVPSLVDTTTGTGFPVYLAVARGETVLVSAYFGEDRIKTHDIGGAPPHAALDEIATPEEPHAAHVDSSGARVYVPHRTGGLTRWHGIAADGSLSEQGEVVAAEGTGPRHLAFSPGGDHAYLVHEFADSVGAHSVAAGGALSHLATTSSLPQGVSGDSNTGADVHVTPDGRYVFASNRGHDSIARFAVQPDGTLSFLGATSTEQRPREFDVSPDGRFLVVAGQDSGHLQSFSIEDNGDLSEAGRLEVGADLRWVIID